MAAEATIRDVSMRFSETGAAEVTAALKGVEAAENAAAIASDKTTKSALSTAASFDRLLRSIDPAYRASQDLAKGMAIVQRTMDQTGADTEVAARAQALLQARYAAGIGGLAATTAGLKAHTDASGKSTAAAMMFESAVHRTVDSLSSGLPITTIAVQQGSELAAAFGMAGGVAGAMEALLSPMTLMIVGFTAAVGVFRLLSSASHDLEEGLKQHEEIIRRVKDAYGEAGKSIEAYGAESRKLIDHDLDSDIRERTKALQEQAKLVVGGMQEVRIDPQTGNQVLALAQDYQQFGDAFDKLRQSIAAGKPDLIALQTYILDHEKLDPTNAALREMGDQILALSKSGVEAQRALIGASGAVDATGSAAVRNLQAISDYAAAMKSLSAIALPQLTGSDQVAKLLSDATGSAGGASDRARAAGEAANALQRLQDQLMPLPRTNPSRDLTSDYGVPTSKQETAAERQAKQIQAVTTSLNQQLAALYETDREQAIANALAQAHTTDATKQGQAIEALAGALYDQKREIEAINQAEGFFAQTIESAFEGLITGGAKLTDTIDNITKALVQAIIQAELLGSGPLAGILGTAPTTAGQTGGILGALASALIPSFGSALPGSTPVGQGGIGHAATGGLIRGPGTGTSDSIPAMLSDGEFVINAGATSMNRGLLEAINSGQRHYAGGGYVTPLMQPARSAGLNAAPNVNIHIEAPEGTSVDSTSSSPNNVGGTEVLVKLVKREVNRHIGSGGADPAMLSRYGTKPRGAKWS